MQRIGVLSLIVCLLLMAGVPAVRGDETPAPSQPGEGPVKKPGEVDEKTRGAIEKGMKYLSAIQERTSGAFGEQNKLAATSLAGIAFLSGGNVPGRGLYCKNVEQAIEFILKNAITPSGYLQFQNSNMYSHGFAAMFLAETYGMIPPYTQQEPKVRKALTKAIQLIEKCQNSDGGWWYDPIKNSSGQGADISVTVCETNALRAARNCGIAVDKRVIENAIKCVKSAANDDGGFSYRVINGKKTEGSAFARSAGAVCILLALGAYDSVEAKKGLEYLIRTGMPEKGGMQMQFAGAYLYYASYYASQAMFMSGKQNWDKWWPFIRDVMLGQADSRGAWPQSEGGSSAYSTAIALIVLQMPYRYLPIFQEGVDNAAGTQPSP
jgi:hypothetical protein